MPTRQTWKTKVRGVLRIFNSSSAKAARNEELEFTSSAIYSDDSDDYNSDNEEEGGKKFGKKGPLSIKSASSDKSNTNTITSINSQECYECGKLRTINWCKNCESKDFIKKFPNWSSKNDLLDKFIRNTQYKAHNHRYYWEWIPFEKFSNIQFLTNGGQSNVFTAIWLEGPRNLWDNENFMFIRRKLCKVILKRLPYAPFNITPEFINELRKCYGHQRSRCSRIVQIYGLTLDPKSGRYMLVTAYHNKLDIRTLLQENSNLTWSDRLRLLKDSAEALLDIHSNGHIHKNIHPGNLLLHSRGNNIFLNINDLGLCNYNYNNNNNNNNDNNNNSNHHHHHHHHHEILGVIPYIAPEIFNCWPYTQDSDIYGFSMLMFELATGRPPFYDRAHDQHLIFDICEGLRPKFDFNEIPECYVDLMKQCWDTEPVIRPSANEILFTINNWDLDDFLDKKFNDQDYDIHPDAIYISRPLGELISRELELQDQAWEVKLYKTELYEQDNDEQDNEMEGSSSAFEDDDEEEEEEEEVDDDENDEEEGEDDDDEKDEEKEYESDDEDDEDERVSNTEQGDDNSNSEQLVESKTNEFQLKLELNFGGSSSDLTKINEMENQNDSLLKSNERVDDDNNDDDDDDSLTESSSNNTTSNTSVFDEESKHEDN